MDDQTFRKAMGKFATGVTVVTTQFGEEIHGMTANAFMSVSLNPKLVLISIDHKANMIDYINNTGKFAISILNEGQKDISAYFAGQNQESREIDFNWFNDMPTIKESLANLTCEVHDSVVAGDHTLYIGKVTDIKITDGEPLAFYEGKYRQMQNGAGVN
ncbi:NADH-FMN oxidoreductase RutF, flavin reductase (DIM6/NTAB) family [Oceanobacillus limi]|uniref:NADH-FMN oxidoreductase RutF, flavin reductase (DIM6/NTAB) family n=1 Tax=Oceanobacillus limi TaxID=930131 RepID=A0A1I0FRN7_9BACI|nr:flavin reductase family protein [Oceanobacillus limi]SET60014.1 NADH-FMN oxidoreductase RutF, flavin reductase (DIM6/NTAB) family [Oceanobacillus limi]